MRYRRAPDLAWQAVGPETVIIDLRRGRSLGLNETGGLVWGLVGEHDAPEIAAEVARRFRIGEDEARKDVARLLEALLDRGLLEEA